MRANVLTDAALTKQAGRFAWLSVDTEKPKNANFLEKLPVQAWPTFLIVDATTEQPLLRWYGTATIPQLLKMLDDGERAWRKPDAVLATADRLNAERKWREAAAKYREAMQAGNHDPRVLESLLRALQFARERQDCVNTTLAEAPKLPRGTAFEHVVSTGFICALGASADTPWRDAALANLKPLGEEALRLPDLLADDRAELYGYVIDAEKDPRRAKQLAREWFDFLEAERKRAKTAEARAASDGLRVTAALRMGDPARAVPDLEASERELPNDYNPPARLAVLYGAIGRYDDALAASDRALAKAYGPRKESILKQRAQIERAKSMVR